VHQLEGCGLTTEVFSLTALPQAELLDLDWLPVGLNFPSWPNHWHWALLRLKLYFWVKNLSLSAKVNYIEIA
jgi:hypothetical protein